MTNQSQPGILDALPAASRYLEFHLKAEADPSPALHRLAGLTLDGSMVFGFGSSLVDMLKGYVPGLRSFPAYTAAGIDVPSTPAALWVWLRGEDRGDLVHRARELRALLHSAFTAGPPVDAFMHQGGRDLSGYEDGTENPTGDAAVSAALISGAGHGLDGGAFVSVQRWAHDLAHLAELREEERDDIIGRRRTDNEELESAPPSAHVKRTAQESFEPAAFVLRRSMPWSGPDGEGLIFVAFCHTLDAFEAQLARMCGRDDGITDGLFRFTRPVTGAHYFCPPRRGDHLDLRAFGL